MYYANTYLGVKCTERLSKVGTFTRKHYVYKQ